MNLDEETSWKEAWEKSHPEVFFTSQPNLAKSLLNRPDIRFLGVKTWATEDEEQFLAYSIYAFEPRGGKMNKKSISERYLKVKDISSVFPFLTEGGIRYAIVDKQPWIMECLCRLGNRLLIDSWKLEEVLEKGGIYSKRTKNGGKNGNLKGKISSTARKSAQNSEKLPASNGKSKQKCCQSHSKPQKLYSLPQPNKSERSKKSSPNLRKDGKKSAQKCGTTSSKRSPKNRKSFGIF